MKIQRSNCEIVETTIDNLEDDFNQLWRSTLSYASESVMAPDIYLCAGNRVVDCSGVGNQAQVFGVIQAELPLLDAAKPFVLVGSKNSLWGNR